MEPDILDEELAGFDAQVLADNYCGVLEELADSCYAADFDNYFVAADFVVSRIVDCYVVVDSLEPFGSCYCAAADFAVLAHNCYCAAAGFAALADNCYCVAAGFAELADNCYYVVAGFAALADNCCCAVAGFGGLLGCYFLAVGFAALDIADN